MIPYLMIYILYIICLAINCTVKKDSKLRGEHKHQWEQDNSKDPYAVVVIH